MKLRFPAQQKMRDFNKDTSVEEFLLRVNLDRKVGLPDVGTRKRCMSFGARGYEQTAV